MRTSTTTRRLHRALAVTGMALIIVAARHALAAGHEQPDPAEGALADHHVQDAHSAPPQRPHPGDSAAGAHPSAPSRQPEESRMSPVRHQVSGSALVFDLAAERRTVHEQLATTTRTARTLVKNGPLRATLMGLAAGGEIASHKADGPITVHVLEGAVEFEAEGRTHELAAGSLFALDAGIVHTVRSRDGGIFLLTVAAPPAR